MMQLKGMQIMNDLLYDTVGRNHAILDDGIGKDRVRLIALGEVTSVFFRKIFPAFLSFSCRSSSTASLPVFFSLVH